jgi:hypothetical protein
MNENLLNLAQCRGGCSKAMVCGRVRGMLVFVAVVMVRVMIGARVVMFRVNCFTVFVRFEHHVHVRIKQKNEITNQRDRTTQAQPLRFLFSRSHSKTNLLPTRAHLSRQTQTEQVCFTTEIGNQTLVFRAIDQPLRTSNSLIIGSSVLQFPLSSGRLLRLRTPTSQTRKEPWGSGCISCPPPGPALRRCVP